MPRLATPYLMTLYTWGVEKTPFLNFKDKGSHSGSPTYLSVLGSVISCFTSLLSAADILICLSTMNLKTSWTLSPLCPILLAPLLDSEVLEDRDHM